MIDTFNRNRPLGGQQQPALRQAEAPPQAPPQAAPVPAQEPPAPPQQQPPETPQAPPAPAQPAAPPAPQQPAQAPSPVQAQLGAPAQPPADPYAPHFALMGRFEGNGVNPTSGASGFGQVLPRTYAYWVTRYGAQNPWMPRTLEEYRNAPEAVQQRVYREIVYPNEYQPVLQRAGLEFSPINAAVVNFLGPTGGVSFLQGVGRNPNAPGTEYASAQAVAANRPVFYHPDGRPRTAGEVLQYIANPPGRGGGGGGALSGNPQAPTGTPTDPANQAQANPYRERLLGLLTQIEGERNSRPNQNELFLRLGAGILSGRDIMDGMGRGGAMVAEQVQQNRVENQTRDRTLVSGYQGLVNDRSMQNARTTYGAPSNVRLTMPDGSVRDIMTRTINGEPHAIDPNTNNWRPVQEIYPNSQMRVQSRNIDDTLEGSWQGIQGARSGAMIGDVPVPVFSIGSENERRGYVLGRAAVASTIRLQELENSGKVDPTGLTSAIDQFVNSQPQGVNRWTFLDQFARAYQQQAGRPLTAEEREYTVRMLQFINATGRADSGAQINAGEWAMYRNMFAPRLNDPSGSVQVLQGIRRDQAASLAASAGMAPGNYLLGALEGRFRINSGVADAAGQELRQTREGEQARRTATAQPGPLTTNNNPSPAPGGEPRRLSVLNPTVINALRDDEQVQVQNGGQWQTITGRELKAELTRRQQQQPPR